MNINGSNIEQHELPHKEIKPALIGIHNDKLYFTYNELNEIYIADTNFENIELFSDTFTCSITPCFSNGYIYYQTNYQTTQKEGVTIKHQDLCRRPISEMLNDKNEEVVLENIVFSGFSQNQKLMIYFHLNDVQIKTLANSKKGMALNIYRMYDFAEEASELILDFRNDETKSTYPLRFYSKNCHIYVQTIPFQTIFVNRKAGETINAEGIFD